MVEKFQKTTLILVFLLHLEFPQKFGQHHVKLAVSPVNAWDNN